MSDNIRCPAFCRNSGLCGGVAIFSGKCGRPVPCSPGACPWADQRDALLANGQWRTTDGRLVDFTGYLKDAGMS